jgi:large subunit ribosomal protein L10
LNRQEKEVFVAQMNDRLRRAEAAFLVDYQGLDVEAMSRLRKELKKCGAEFEVVKNRLLNLASQDTGTACIKEHFVGPCALALTYDDIISAAKVLVDLSKDYQKMRIKIGQTAGRVIDLSTIERLAALPGRDDLLAQVFATMQAVPTSLVRVLNGVLANVLNVLKAIEAKKDTDEEKES